MLMVLVISSIVADPGTTLLHTTAKVHIRNERGRCFAVSDLTLLPAVLLVSPSNVV